MGQPSFVWGSSVVRCMVCFLSQYGSSIKYRHVESTRCTLFNSQFDHFSDMCHSGKPRGEMVLLGSSSTVRIQNS